MGTEVWRDIDNCNGAYQVSNMGRVRSVDRVIIDSRGKQLHLIGKIIQPQRHSGGYLKVMLSINNVHYQHLIHRLVGLAFIPNPENKPEVNHRFGDKKDNRASELEWVTPSANQRHSYDVLKRKGVNEGKFGVNNGKTRKIVCDTLGGKVFASVSIAASELKMHVDSVYKVCNGNLNHIRGHKFRYLTNA